MKRRLLFSALICTQAAQPAFAARWVLVSRPFAVQKVSIDRDSIAQQGTVMTFVAKVTDPVQQPISPDITVDAQGLPVNTPAATLNIDGTAYAMQLSCTARTVRLAASGAITNGQVNPFGATNISPYTFQPLTGDVSYALYGALCWQNPALGLAPAPVFVTPQDPTPRRTINPVQNPWPLTRY